MTDRSAAPHLPLCRRLFSRGSGELAAQPFRRTAVVVTVATLAASLYDAVVFSLYDCLGVKGQKVLIVITDCQDTSSKFQFDQALEYARRAAVPIYGVGIGIKSNQIDVKYKFVKFWSETGGNVYYIDRAQELGRIYTDIQNELGSQYVLGFYPPT